jgi:parallel beta-helix repeat protein
MEQDNRKVAATTAEGGRVTFYVATEGNDHWSGKLAAPNAERSDGPFATLVRARDAVRELKEATGGLTTPVRVLVRGGKYHLDWTLVLGADDSGTMECPITYTAFSGEQVVLSGGKRVSGWKPYQGAILQCALPEAKGARWKLRQLFYNGERQFRARWPNHDPQNPLLGGWLFPEDGVEERSYTAFRYRTGAFPRRWEKPTQAEIFKVNHFGVTDIIPIKAIDEETRVITLTDSSLSHEVYPWFVRTPIRSDCRFRVENLLEELDQPGEWCVDTDEGMLYFWPPDEDIEIAEVVVPVLDCLIFLRGASHITISGFTFTETTSGDNMHRDGHEGYGAMFPISGRRYCGEAVHLRGARNCIIENNKFYAVGGNAIYLEDHNMRNTVRHNEIDQAGACGVVLIGSKYFHPVPHHPMYNEVIDNHIHHCGVFNRYVAGVFLGLCDSNVIGHNLIEDMPHHAINLGNSGYGRNIIERNETRRVCQETRDNGAINCWMEDPHAHLSKDAERSGHVIRYNRIIDTGGCEVSEGSNLVAAGNVTHGIYLDNYTSNCFVYGNIIVRSYSVGIYIQGGKNNIVENNIIVDSLSAFHLGGWWQPQMEGFMTGNRYRGNVFYGSQEFGREALRLFYHIAFRKEPITDAIGMSDYNVFFNAAGEEFIVRHRGPSFLFAATEAAFAEEKSLAEWQRMGFDEHSVVANPLFVDPENDDYRLKPESPALTLGFTPIDVSQIGVRTNKSLH